MGNSYSAIILAIAVAIAVITSPFMTYYGHQQKLIAEMVSEEGVTPAEASCALTSDENSCIISMTETGVDAIRATCSIYPGRIGSSCAAIVREE